MTALRDRTQRGAALPLAIGAVLVVSVITVGLAGVGRTALRLAAARRDASGALAAADLCVARTVVGLATDWDFAVALAGPDGLAGTADDGTIGGPPGCTIALTAAPGPPLPPRLLAFVDARRGRGQRRLSALLRRAPDPGAGALLWSADAATLGPVPGALQLDGVDHAGTNLPPLSALAAPADPVVLDGWVAGVGPRLTVAPGTALPITWPAPPLTGVVARARATPAAAPFSIAGAAPAPTALSIAAGDLTLGTPGLGAGLLVVDGTLVVGAGFDFRGIVVATRGLRVEPGATCVVHGELWIGSPPTGPALDVAGVLRIERDRLAVTAADGLLALPRRAVLAGVLDAT